MRLLHTSDWHLGHTLRGHSRRQEHQAFLDWLLQQLEVQKIDALLVAGDIFDTANPSAASQHQWYRFLGAARERYPALDIVVIGGNHDSAARLDAATPLLETLQVHVVGGLRRGQEGDLQPDPMVVPLHDSDGAVTAWVVAMPYLRVPDLPRVEAHEDRLVAGVRELYREVLDVARARRSPEHALIAMGHCYMTGTALSELSERKILGGNQHALPADVFPRDVTYVALGHLHLPQEVGESRIRYSGSPIPLSLAERTYPHQVLVVEFDGPELGLVKTLRVPRTVQMVRVPDGDDPALLPEVLAQLEQLPEGDGDDPNQWPFLEVHVRLLGPEPGLRRQVESAIEGKRLRLVKLQTHYDGTGQSLAEAVAAQTLSDLSHEEVFRLAWERKYAETPGEQALSCFHELLDRVGQEDDCAS